MRIRGDQKGGDVRTKCMTAKCMIPKGGMYRCD